MAVRSVQVAVHQVAHHAITRYTVILNIERRDACGNLFIFNFIFRLLTFLILIIRLTTDVCDFTQIRDGIAFAVQFCNRFVNLLAPNPAYLRLLSSSSNFFKKATSTSVFFRLRRSRSSSRFSWSTSVNSLSDLRRPRRSSRP
mgnify:CR=1 FL=1